MTQCKICRNQLNLQSHFYTTNWQAKLRHWVIAYTASIRTVQYASSQRVHLSIQSTGDDVLCVGRVSKAGHAAEMTLLFEHMCLALPLPHTQLPHLTARQRYPLRRLVDCHRRYCIHCRRVWYAAMYKQFTANTRLTALFLGLPGWAGTRKVKPIWILLKQETVRGSGISWAICKSAPCSRQITTPAPHQSSFLQVGCSSCHPTNSVKALKAVHSSAL